MRARSYPYIHRREIEGKKATDEKGAARLPVARDQTNAGARNYGDDELMIADEEPVGL